MDRHDLDAVAERALALAERQGVRPPVIEALRLATSGLSYRAIGRAVGMTGGGVSYWVTRFGLRTLHDFRAASRPEVREREVRRRELERLQELDQRLADTLRAS